MAGGITLPLSTLSAFLFLLCRDCMIGEWTINMNLDKKNDETKAKEEGGKMPPAPKTNSTKTKKKKKKKQ